MARKPPAKQDAEYRPLGPRYIRSVVRGWSPERIASTIDEAKRGDFTAWSELQTTMLLDYQVRSTSDTLLASVTGAEVEWEAGVGGDKGLAQEARDVIASQWEQLRGSSALISDIGFALLGGATVVQQEWGVVDGVYAPTGFLTVPTEDIRIGDDWCALVRTRPDGSTYGAWVPVTDEPHRWIVTYARFPGVTRTLAGALMACAWPWLGKAQLGVFELQGLERFGDPVFAGIMSTTSGNANREAMEDAIQALSSGESIALEDGQDIRVIESARQTGQAHADAIARRDAAISKAILGSTLNTEIGAAGGNRAAAESQAETTILPRERALAEMVSESIESQWASPILYYATGKLFGGRKPPTPRMWIRLAKDEPPRLDAIAMEAGAYTYDDVRASVGLEPVGGTRGARIVRPSASPGLTPSVSTRPGAVDAEPKAESALNGAQVASLLAVVEKVAQGLISRESGIAALMTSFGMTRETADANLGPIDFVPRVMVDEGAVVEPIEASNVAGDNGASNVDHTDRVKSPTALDLSDEYAGFLRLSGEKQEAIASLIGRPREAIARGVEATADILRAEYATLAERLADASSQDEAESVAMAWAADLANSERITEAAFHANALAQMAGVETARMELDRSGATVRLSLADERFLGLSFEEALALFRERSGRAAAAVDTMLEEELARARTVTRAMSEHAEMAILGGIDSALQVDGMSLRDFVREFANRVDAGDLPGGDAGYLEMVYRTTVATSYEAGRQEVLTDPDIVEQIGGYEIVTVGDDRTEPSHAALDGMQVRGSDAARMKFAPWRYGCRCEVVAVDAEDMDESRIIDPSALDAVIFDGFGDPVGYLRDPS
jgi:SPP1 gp7 family putative phage head morphogenesis protein